MVIAQHSMLLIVHLKWLNGNLYVMYILPHFHSLFRDMPFTCVL